MRKFMNVNLVVKAVAVVLMLTFLPQVLNFFAYVLLLQIGLIIAEMAINSFMAADGRSALHDSLKKVTRMDDEGRLKFKRPFFYLCGLVRAFFKKDFSAAAKSEEVV